MTLDANCVSTTPATETSRSWTFFDSSLGCLRTRRQWCRSGGEQDCQYLQNALRRRPVQCSELSHQACLVDRTVLVEHYLPRRATERDGDTRWVGSALGGHRRNDDGAQMTVHFVRRD